MSDRSDLPGGVRHETVLQPKKSNFHPMTATCVACDWTFTGASGATYVAMQLHEDDPLGSDETSTRG